jgi:hypothetical protein
MEPKTYVLLKSASAADERASADHAARLTEAALLAEHEAATALLQSVTRRVAVLAREIKRRQS